jgi:hypothetical protein
MTSQFLQLTEEHRVVLSSTVPESNHKRKKWEGLVCIGVMFWVIMAPMDMAFGIYDEGYRSHLVLSNYDAQIVLNVIMMH